MSDEHDLDDVDLTGIKVYFKFNCSPDLPALIRQAATQAGFKHSSDWARHHLVGALALELNLNASEILDRQPSWGEGKGAVDPEYVARRYGRAHHPSAGESGV